MKVLVATKETQGDRKSDFSYTNEGELVYFGSECDSEEIDGSCGCRRAVCGMESHKATTTMKVAELPLTEDEYKAKYAAYLVSSGWVKQDDAAGLKEWTDGDVKELHRIATEFPTGAVLERRGDQIQERAKKRIIRR